MMKYVGWIGFFLVIVGLAVGGFFSVSSFSGDTFEFKEVEILDYDDFTIQDLVEQDVVCNDKGCKFKDKDVIYTISEVKDLGKQDVTLKIEYEGEKFEKTFHVDVVDKKEPEIVLNESAIIVDLNEKIDTASYIAEVTDNYDTLSVDDIEIENNVDLKNPGDYEVVYIIRDSSGNVGKSVLKVKVKGEREVVSSNDDKKEEIEDKKEVTWNYEISGLYDESGLLNQDRTKNSIQKNIEVGWDATFKISSEFQGSGNYAIKTTVSRNKITGKEVNFSNTDLPRVSEKHLRGENSYQFEYTFQEEGTYYILIMVRDVTNNITMEKEVILHLTSPSEVQDMKISTIDEGEYLTFEVEYIGGGDQNYYFVVVIADSDDPNFEDALQESGDEIRLYYKKGYYYDILGSLVTEDGDIVLAKTITVQK